MGSPKVSVPTLMTLVGRKAIAHPAFGKQKLQKIISSEPADIGLSLKPMGERVLPCRSKFHPSFTITCISAP